MCHSVFLIELTVSARGHLISTAEQAAEIQRVVHSESVGDLLHVHCGGSEQHARFLNERLQTILLRRASVLCLEQIDEMDAYMSNIHSKTLIAGQTTLSFEGIPDGSIVDIYAPLGVECGNPDKSYEDGVLTLTFAAQEVDMNVKVRVW